MVESLASGDIACIVVYFVLVLAVGLWTSMRPNKNSTAGYFLAGKDMHWFPIGASLFASNVGAPMFIGLAGTAAASGFAVTIYEWHAIFLLIALGWIFVPVYAASGAYTMPEFLKKRFGGVRLRILLSVLALVLYVLTKISSEIFAGAIFMQQILGWNLYLCICGILALTAVYTVAGGLAAVIYTDTLQSIVLVIGAAILFIINIIDIGGWAEFIVKYGASAANETLMAGPNRTCGLPRDDFHHIWRDTKTGDIPWTGAVFGLTTLGITVWCTDQIMVQRCLSAKNMSHAKGGTVLAAAMKIAPFLLFIVPGMISRALYPDEIACSDPQTCKDVCGNEAGCSNIAYPLLVLRTMPPGLKGIMLAGLLAALMSSLTSIFNSASSMFTIDIWKRLRRQAGQNELMVVGRVCIVILFLLSIVWIPIMQKSQGGQLWIYLQTISACLSPPWCWVFLLALFWKGTTEAGAFWGLVISLCVGVARMVLEFTYSSPPCGSDEEDTRPSVLKDVHFLHFAIIISGVSIIVTVAISLFTEKRTEKQLHRVTWWTRHDAEEPIESDSENEDDDEEEDNIAKEEELEGELRPPMGKTLKARFVYWLCGIDNGPRPKISKEERAAIKKKMTDISENPLARTLSGFAAILVAVITVYLLGFFH